MASLSVAMAAVSAAGRWPGAVASVALTATAARERGEGHRQHDDGDDQHREQAREFHAGFLPVSE